MNRAKIRVLVVDDEPLARNLIRNLLALEGDVEIVAECGNAREATRLMTLERPELLLLDIQMPGTDGFGLLQNLDKGRPPLVIFATAHEQYAVRAFEIDAIDYLLKPFDRERFRQSIDRARRVLHSDFGTRRPPPQSAALSKEKREEQRFRTRLLIKVGGRIAFLRTDEIEWIKAEDKYINLYCGRSNYLVRRSLNAIMAELDPNTFVQIHRSALVNIDRITELQQMFNGEYAIILGNGTTLNVGRHFRNLLFERIGSPL